MDWHLLPSELRSRDQWVCSDETKRPIDAKTGFDAAVDDRTTWSSFAQVTRAAVANGWDIGYVLSEDDPFSIVDLDNKPSKPAPEAMQKVHADILNRSDTYIERSVGGYGYHVIVRGTCKRPIKTPHIEQYSSLRMMVCTGDVVKDLPVADGQELLDLIDTHFGSSSTYVDLGADLPDSQPDVDELPDEEIIRRGTDAENGDKFKALWEGDISLFNGDHSRADSALLNLLCFLTPSNEQVRRIFRMSALFRPNQRNRSTNRYLNYSIHKWRAENPPLDLSQFDIQLPESKPRSLSAMAVESAPDVAPIPQAPAKPKAPPCEFPPGIIGEVAQFTFDTSYMQIREGSLVASIGYFAGLIGRGYHINGLGLNQYLVFIGDSGVGKEGGKRGIRAVHHAVYSKVPAAQACIGSADFSAGVSLVKELAEHPCMLGIAGEIGLVLKGMLDHRAPAHVQELKRALTDAWSESGPNGILNSRRYSDRAKNVQDVRRPAYSIIGETVPSHFYNSLSDEVINDGFIPRWLVVEYEGLRPYPNRNPLFNPPEAMIDQICDLFIASKSLQDSGQMKAIMLDDDASSLFIKFEDHVSDQVRALPKEHPVKAILNRTNEKALKLAGLIAVTMNPYEPVVTRDVAIWAQRFVTQSDSHMVTRFNAGSIGQGEETFESMVRDAIRKYQTMTPAQKQAAKCPKCLLDQPAIPRAYLSDFLKRKAQIKNHRFGSAKAIDIAIEESCANGLLMEMPLKTRNELKMRGGMAYLLGDSW